HLAPFAFNQHRIRAGKADDTAVNRRPDAVAVHNEVPWLGPRYLSVAVVGQNWIDVKSTHVKATARENPSVAVRSCIRVCGLDDFQGHRHAESGFVSLLSLQWFFVRRPLKQSDGGPTIRSGNIS